MCALATKKHTGCENFVSLAVGVRRHRDANNRPTGTRPRMRAISRLVLRRCTKFITQAREKVDCLLRCVNASDRSRNDVQGSVEERQEDSSMQHKSKIARHLDSNSAKKLRDLHRKLHTPAPTSLQQTRPTHLHHEARSENEVCSTCGPAMDAVLQHLDVAQMKNLVKSIENKCDSVCVFVNSNSVQFREQTLEPYFLTCKYWRWTWLPERDTKLLKQTPFCSKSDDEGRVCCNPYHWSIQVNVGKALVFAFKLYSTVSTLINKSIVLYI